MKRSFRDPYGGWWDAQEKRNFGEPVHEENEILGVFSPEQYTHVSAGKGFFHLGCFVVAFLSVCGVVSLYYPDKPSVPKAYVDGLEKELGGPNASPVRLKSFPMNIPLYGMSITNLYAGSQGWRGQVVNLPLLSFLFPFCCVCKYQDDFVSLDLASLECLMVDSPKNGFPAP